MERIRERIIPEVLVVFELVLAFLGALAGIQWNVPLFFYALFVFNQESTHHFRMFLVFLGLSVILDVTWMGLYAPFYDSLMNFCFSMSIISLVFKIPVALLTVIGIKNRESGGAQSVGDQGGYYPPQNQIFFRQ